MRRIPDWCSDDGDVLELEAVHRGHVLLVTVLFASIAWVTTAIAVVL